MSRPSDVSGEASPAPHAALRKPRIIRSAASSFSRCDSESFHLPIKMAALESQHFRSAADISLILFQLAQDVIAFVRGARLVQAEETPGSGDRPGVPVVL